MTNEKTKLTYLVKAINAYSKYDDRISVIAEEIIPVCRELDDGEQIIEALRQWEVELKPLSNGASNQVESFIERLMVQIKNTVLN